MCVQVRLELHVPAAHCGSERMRAVRLRHFMRSARKVYSLKVTGAGALTLVCIYGKPFERCRDVTIQIWSGWAYENKERQEALLTLIGQEAP